MDDPSADLAAHRDTIGSLTYYDGLAPMHVRGYGLVVGLGENGSTECPPQIYERLVQAIHKQRRAAGRNISERSVSPEKMINDIDTAVVVVQGYIPPAACKGSTFDVAVSAIPGTQTKSLVGGRLYTAELEIVQSSSSGASSGRVLAKAAGPVFVDPFPEGESASSDNPLTATILGGGIATDDRRVRLALAEPSYGNARRIQDRINGQFPAREKIAEAVSPSFVQLRVPEEYRDDTVHFLNLVRGLYLTRDPAFEQARADELAKDLTTTSDGHADIALCLEGLGRNGSRVLDGLYTNSKDSVSFFSAAAGLRLADHLAVDAMSLHALDPNCPYRNQAIHALGSVRGIGGAGTALRRLMADSDPKIRIAAYDALVDRRDSAVTSIPIGGDSFILDVIQSSQPNIVYVKRNGSRRVALIGDDFRCLPPLFYRAPDGSVLLDSKERDQPLTVVRTVAATGSMSPPVRASKDLPKLVQMLGSEAGVGTNHEVTGLGLDYTAVGRLLYHLCKDGAINATVMLEDASDAELPDGQKTEGRPESD